jgi:hypothetical protein
MGIMRLKSRVERGIYRVGKPVSTAGKVLKSRVCLVLLRCMSTYYSQSGVRPIVPRRTSVYYLQSTTYYW